MKERIKHINALSVTRSMVNIEVISCRCRCAVSLVRCRHASHPLCICGELWRSSEHTVNDGPVTRFPGGLWTLNQADEDALLWLGTQGKRQTTANYYQFAICPVSLQSLERRRQARRITRINGSVCLDRQDTVINNRRVCPANTICLNFVASFDRINCQIHVYFDSSLTSELTDRSVTKL